MLVSQDAIYCCVIILFILCLPMKSLIMEAFCFGMNRFRWNKLFLWLHLHLRHLHRLGLLWNHCKKSGRSFQIPAFKLYFGLLILSSPFRILKVVLIHHRILQLPQRIRETPVPPLNHSIPQFRTLQTTQSLLSWMCLNETILIMCSPLSVRKAFFPPISFWYKMKRI